jgi:hypothetical protein
MLNPSKPDNVFLEAVEISAVGIAFQPLNWMIRNLDLSSQSHTQSLRAAGITNFLENGGSLEVAMKPLQKLLFDFSLAAAALIATAVLWITDDYYTTLFASHPDHRPMFPHSLAWSFPYVFQGREGGRAVAK